MELTTAVIFAFCGALCETLGNAFFERWKAHAMLLVIFKGFLGSLIFIAILFFDQGVRWVDELTWEIIAWLACSALLGIVVADPCWIYGLQLIGTKLTLLVKLFNPFASALLAWGILGETITLLMIIGIPITAVGVGIVLTTKSKTEIEDETSVQKVTIVSPHYGATDHHDTDDLPQEESHKIEYRDLVIGISSMLFSITFDNLGSILTKKFASDINAWSVCLVRFFLGSVFLTIIYCIQLCFAYIKDRKEKGRISFIDENGEDMKEEEGNQYSLKWPREYKMYLWATIGVVLLTVFSNFLWTWAMFRIKIGVANTITSSKAIFAIPVVYVMNGEKSTWVTLAGVIIAMGGILPLAINPES